MKIRRLILFVMGGLCLLAPVQSFAIIIPLDRTINWTPGTVTGVIGGIPNRTTIYKNLVTDLGADNTGVTSISSILSTTINNCPANQVIYLPAGTYRIDTRVLQQFQSKYTIRGAGQGLTTLKAYTGVDEPLHFGNSNYPRPSAAITITAGATKGSTTVTCDNTSTVTIGKMVRIEQTNPTWVKPLNGGSNSMNALFKVASKTSTTVTFSPALPWTLTNSPKMAIYSLGPLEGIGIENLTLDITNSTSSSALYFESCRNCWIKNVELKSVYNKALFLLWCSNMEIRHCYIHDGRGSGPNHEGIDFYESGCWNLVEDNIIVASGYPMIVLGDSQGGCTGNVIAYNYCENIRPGTGIAGDSICDNHGPHNSMNLIEGNVAQSFESDGYKGGSSHSTLFRNWFSGNFAPPDNGIQRAIALKHYAVYYNIVGNVLGYPGSTNAYDIETNGYNGYGANAVVYQLGYPNAGNTGYSGTIAATTPPDYTAEPNNITVAPERLDYNVKNTLLRHGNYVYAADWNRVEWDSAISDHNIPASMYRTARPAWWAPNIAWPPIGPDRTPMVSEIPAQIRFRTLALPPPNPPENLRIVP